MECLDDVATKMRMNVIRMIGEAGSGHPGGSLSCIDILTALYFGGVMSYDPLHPDDSTRDRFVLAKGHAAPALYATLAQASFITEEELLTLRKLGSRLQGHPDSSLVPGVEVSTGSLGQGLSIACGIAYGLRLSKNNACVFTLLGDGECEEGQVWEAAMFAAHQRLDGLVAIIDNNCLQIDGHCNEVCDPGDLGKKFEVFGWSVSDVDGHNIKALIDCLNQVKAHRCEKPHLVIAHTIKGKGVSFMEDQVGWHGKAPNAEQVECALEELSAKIDRGEQ